MTHSELEGRYNRYHSHNTVTFYLDDFIPDIEECRILMLKVIEQAVRDYQLLGESQFINDKVAFETAKAFIFEDDYYFKWGEMELSTKDFLDILDLDIEWLRDQVNKQQRKVNNGRQKEIRTVRKSGHSGRKYHTYRRKKECSSS